MIVEERIVFHEKQYKGYNSNKDYTACQRKVNSVYEIQPNGINIEGSKYYWHQNGENKLSKVRSDQLQ